MPATGRRLRIERIQDLEGKGWIQREIAADLGISAGCLSQFKSKYMASPETLYDRWLNVHDIRGIGERAVEETG